MKFTLELDIKAPENKEDNFTPWIHAGGVLFDIFRDARIQRFQRLVKAECKKDKTEKDKQYLKVATYQFNILEKIEKTIRLKE